jgi:L-asparaginase
VGNGKCKLIIHGGAGRLEGKVATKEQYRVGLQEAIGPAYKTLCEKGARAGVIHAIKLLESDPIFNAGTGSKLQKDGRVRMSAAMMDSIDSIFSGVINIYDVEHPIEVADCLRDEIHHILSGNEATEYARRKGFMFHDPITMSRFIEYRKALRSRDKFGTVGAVAVDEEGTVAAGTSTGGVGHEIPGRVSDSASVAGTFADSAGGVSCTGKGEHIINQAVAAQVVSRLRDNIPLKRILTELMKEGASRNHEFGLISLNGKGNYGVRSTKRSISVLYALKDENLELDFTNGGRNLIL